MNGRRQIWALYLNDRCNLGCDYCYLEGLEPSGAMTPQTVRKAIEFIERYARSQDAPSFDVGMFGREPLMDPELVKTVIRLSERIKHPHTISLNTNGTLLTRELLSELDAAGVRIALSIDGTEKTHDRLRRFPDGAGSYARIAGIIPDLVSLSTPVHARMTVTRETAGDVRENVAHLFDLGFRRVSFFCDLTVEWADEALESYRRSLGELVTWYVAEIVAGRDISLPAFDSAIRGRSVPDAGLFCGAASTLFSIGTDGSIYPCWRFVGDRDFIMGDVFSGFKANPESHPFNRVDQARYPRCVECRHASACGRCAWVSLKTGGSIESVSVSQCLTSRRVIEAGLDSCRRLVKSGSPLFMKRIGDWVVSGGASEPEKVAVKDRDGSLYNIPASILGDFRF